MQVDVFVQQFGPLLILFPFFGAALIGLYGFISPGFRRQESAIGSIATLAVLVPFAVYVMTFLGYQGKPLHFEIFSWMQTANVDISFSYTLDELSLLMGMIVTGVGALIHIYSISYMHGDSGFYRYFMYLNLFIFAMSNLILGDNLIVTFLGWEGVGAASYLLIGFWFTDMEKAKAAQKAFVANRIGDFAFLIGAFIAFQVTGSLKYTDIIANASLFSTSQVFWVCLLFFIAATGKSAQIPLFVWLPDAMAGPTPVSALIHAATMVTSGIYLIARLSELFILAPDVLMIIAVVGALTAAVAALTAVAQYDIKKVLAYSTVSQLGFMFIALGAGAFSTAIFHVMTHAFFKACLFLGSGSVIHSMDHTHAVDDPQDIRTMGGLKKYMPSTYWTFQISTWAIAGIPLLAGFFSKDEILAKTFTAGGQVNPLYFGVWALAVFTAFLTAFYMSRLTYLTFKGEERFPLAKAHGHGHDEAHAEGHGHDHKHEIHLPHESPALMTIPLWILGGLAIVGGYLGLPEVIGHGHYNWISHHWLAAHGEGTHGPITNLALHHLPVSVELFLISLSIIVAFAGVIIAEKLYSNKGLAGGEAKIKGLFGGFYKTLSNKFYFDEVYNAVFIRPFVTLSEMGFYPIDKFVVDGLVNGAGNLTQSLGAFWRRLQSGLIQRYALIMMFGVVFILFYLMR